MPEDWTNAEVIESISGNAKLTPEQTIAVLKALSDHNLMLIDRDDIIDIDSLVDIDNSEVPK